MYVLSSCPIVVIVLLRPIRPPCPRTASIIVGLQVDCSDFQTRFSGDYGYMLAHCAIFMSLPSLKQS